MSTPTSEPILVPSTDGVTLAVHDLGGSEGAPEMLVCHATGFCGRAYGPLADELTARFHVMAVDFRVHGDSSVPENGRLNWAAFGEDVLAVVDGLGLETVFGFGHSLGGGALMLAERARPGTLAAAYLFEPIVLPPGRGMPADAPLGSDVMSAVAVKRRASFPSKAEALLRYASRPPLSTLQAGALAAYVEHGMRTGPDGEAILKCTPENEARTFAAGGKPTYDLLPAVRTPTTVAIGNVERAWTPGAYGPEIAAALPNGRLERHPLLGHFGPLQGPITVGAMVLAAVGAE